MNTIVIVDSDSRWIDNYKRMLAPFQGELNCMYFQHSEQAMEYMSAHKASVLVSELDMPVMSGMELFEMLDMLSPSTVRIAMTKVHDVTKTLEVLNYGQVFRLILKPFFLVEDIIVPIQAAITHHKMMEREKEFQQKTEMELVKLNDRVEQLWGKLAEKKLIYDGICRGTAVIMEENLSPEISNFNQVEAEFIADFCEKLLQEFIQFYMYEKQNFIFFMNYLKNQFHHPGKSCTFKICNGTGGEIPGTVMRRIAYGMFLIGYLCWQFLDSYHIENMIVTEGDAYVLKVQQFCPEGNVSYKIKSPEVLKVLLRTVQDLGRVLSDGVAGQETGQTIAVKMYYTAENSFEFPVR